MMLSMGWKPEGWRGKSSNPRSAGVPPASSRGVPPRDGPPIPPVTALIQDSGCSFWAHSFF